MPRATQAPGAVEIGGARRYASAVLETGADGLALRAPASTSFKITGAGRGRAHVQDGTPELGTLLDALPAGKPDNRLDRLKRLRVQLFSTAIPSLRWLSLETEGKRYCQHDATWYLMDQDYTRRLRERTQAIFGRDPGIRLPEWPPDVDEVSYNVLTARALGGTLFGRKLIYTGLHHRGIEAPAAGSQPHVLASVPFLLEFAPAA